MQPWSTFSSSANANDELYLLMYPYIVVDLWRGQIPSDVGTPEHCHFVWRMLPDLECFSRMGESSNGGRWYQLAHKCEHTMKYDSASRSPIWTTLHCQEGPTSSISSLNERQHQVEPLEMHVRRKRMTRRSHPHQRRLPPSLWRCPLTKRISEKELPETQSRWSPGFSPIACLVLSQWSTPGSPASTSISIDG